MKSLKAFLAFAAVASISAMNATQGKAADSDYIARALSAAPSGVASGATVMRVETDGTMTTLQSGNNGFTCMVIMSAPMCADANSMEFMQAYMKHTTPSNKSGITYMLQGDAPGTSNTDPYAKSKTADNHWIVTGPHIMLFGASAKTLGFTTAADPDPTKPYMMWAGTPYEHAMIPVAASQK